VCEPANNLIHRDVLVPSGATFVAKRAENAVWDGQAVRIAALPSVVGFKRLAGRPRDRQDLADLEAIYGELPVEPIPGVDG